MDKETQDFCWRYDAQVGPSIQQHRRIRRTTLQDWATVDTGTAVRDTIGDYYDQPCVEIHMPLDRFRALMEHDHWLELQQRRDQTGLTTNAVRIAREHERECRIRHEHPAVQAAWEQYQIMLRMVDTG